MVAPHRGGPGGRRAVAEGKLDRARNPLAPKPPNFPAKAKSVIFLFMAEIIRLVEAEAPKVALVVCLLAGASPEGLKPARFASPGLSMVNVDPKVGDFYNEHIAQQLKRKAPKQTKH